MRRHLALSVAAAVIGVAVVQPSGAVGAFSAAQDLRGDRCQERFTGGDGDDTIQGNGRDNVICGRAGLDTLSGGEGDDVVRGHRGGDSVDGDPGDDTLEGGAGADRLDGEAGADRVFGGDGDDGLNGSTGDDFLNGGDGNDSIIGKDGDDVVRGGPGDDIIDLQHHDRFDTHDSAMCGDGADIVYIDAGGDGQGGRDSVADDCETVFED